MSKELEIGLKFNSLKVLSIYRKEMGKDKKRIAKFAHCLCDCGGYHDVEYSNLKTGNTRFCLECSKKRKSRSKREHGHSEGTVGRTKLEAKSYYTWCAMKRRCNNASDKRFYDYGGRGITVCSDWSESYQTFLKDMGLPTSMNHQIDRVNNDGNYTKENCRWVTRKLNARNKRNNKIIEANGISKTQAEWAEETGIKRETIAMRIKRGWSNERAVGLLENDV